MMCGRGFRKFMSRLRNEDFLKGYIHAVTVEFYIQ